MEESSVGTLINEIALNGSVMEESVVLGDQLIPFLENEGSVVLKGIIDQNGRLVLDTYFVEQHHHQQNPPQHENIQPFPSEALGNNLTVHSVNHQQQLRNHDIPSMGKVMGMENNIMQHTEVTYRGQDNAFTHPMGFRALIPNYSHVNQGKLGQGNAAASNVVSGSSIGKRVEQVLPNLQRRPEPVMRDVDLHEPLEPPIGKGPFKCTICGKIFPKWPQLKRHRADHLDDKVFRCSKCPLTFNYDANLKVHMLLHDAEENGCLQCQICPAKFSRLASLKSHLRVHEKDDNLMCPECGDEFPTKSRLEAHLDEHRPKSQNSLLHRCRLCGKSFTQLAMLKDHSKEHAAVRSQLKILNSRKRKGKPKSNSKTSRAFPLVATAAGTSQTATVDPLIIPSRHDKKKKRACNVCGKRFEKPSQLSRHIRIHTGEKPFSCRECGKRFNQKGTMESHIQSMHKKEKPYRCDLCQCAFSQRGNLKAHILKVHVPPAENEKVFKCEECCCVYRRLATLNNHIAKVHSVESMQTAEEAQQVSSLVEAANEAENPVASKSMPTAAVPCSAPQEPLHPSSNQRTLSSTVATNPSTMNDPKSLFSSGVTNSLVPSTQESSLVSTESNSTIPGTSHKENVAPVGGNPADSSISEVRILHTEQGTLRRYPMKVKKVGQVKWHLCPYCQKGFRKPSDLIRHIRVHTQEKPYQCEICGKAFAVKSTLKTHKRTHYPNKDLECRVCHKRFAMLSSLKSHERLHTGLKPFTCMQCGKTFRTSSQRRIHAKVHGRNVHGLTKRKLLRIGEAQPPVELSSPLKITSDGLVPVPNRSAFAMTTKELMEGKFRPYKCKHCPSAFKKSSHLKQHVRSHTGEKPYKCFQCGRSFVSSGVLKNHIKTHEGVRAFSCSICQLTFTTNGSLTRHMATHTTARPYLCPYCRKTFKTSVSCRKHIKTHRDEVMASGNNNPVPVQTTETTTGIHTEQRLESILPPETMTLNAPTNDQSELYLDSNADYHHEQHYSDYGNSVLTENMPPTHENTNNQVMERLPPSHLQQASHHLMPMSDRNNCLVSLPGQQQIMISNEMMSEASMHQGRECHEMPPDTNVHLHYAIPCTESYPNQPVEHPHTRTMDSHTHVQQSGMSESHQAYEQHPAHQATYSSVYEHLDMSGPLQQYINTDVPETGIQAAEGVECVPMGIGNQLTQEVIASFEYAPHPQSLGPNEGGMQVHHPIERQEPQPSQVLTQPPPQRVPAASKQVQQHRLPTSVIKLVSSAQTKADDNTVEKDEIRRIRETSRPISERIYYELRTQGHKLKKNVVGVQNIGAPNQCQYCCRGFRKRSDLQRHLRIHTGEKPFRCQICGKVFRVKSTKEAHMKTHEGVKTVSCHVCNNLFSTKSSLRVHMRLHTGAKPYACPHCDLSFRTSGHRKAHISSHFKPAKENNPEYILSDIPQSVIITNPENITNSQVLPSMSGLKEKDGLVSHGVTAVTSITAAPHDQLELPAEFAAAYENAANLTNGGSTQDALQVIGSVQISVDGPTLQIAGLSGIDLSSLHVDDNFIQNLANVIFLPATTSASQDNPPQEVDHYEPAGVVNEMVHEANHQIPVDVSLPADPVDLGNCNGVLTGKDVNVGDPLRIDPEPQAPSSINSSESALSHNQHSLPSSSRQQLLSHPTESDELNEYVSQTRALKSNISSRKTGSTSNNNSNNSKGRVKISSDNNSVIDRDRYCTLCSKTFAKPSLLARHMRTHTGERPYKCELCQRSFSQQTSLAAHAYTHTNEKPFTCNLCPFRTVQRGSLKKHFTKAHPNSWDQFPNPPSVTNLKC